MGEVIARALVTPPEPIEWEEDAEAVPVPPAEDETPVLTAH
jgi:hypothetical protein